MVNLLKMIRVSYIENRSSIKQKLLIGINILVMVILFYVVGFIKDYIYSCTYDKIDLGTILGM